MDNARVRGPYNRAPRLRRGGVYEEPNAPAIREQDRVARQSGPAALSMPPMVMAAISRIYGDGGWPAVDAGGGAWLYETPLCVGEFTEIGPRQVRLKVYFRGDEPMDPATRECMPVMADMALAFRCTDNLARVITAAEAAAAAELPIVCVRDAMRRAGVDPEMRCNAIALRRLMIDHCRAMRDAIPRRPESALRRRGKWEGYMMMVKRADRKRWLRG